MAAKTIALLTGATISATGGTSVTFTEIENHKKGEMLFANLAKTVKLRETLRLKVVQPRPNKGLPSGYTQGVVRAKLVIPKVLTDGTLTHDYVSNEKSFCIETAAEEHTVLNDYMAQLGFDSELADFRNSLSLG